MSKIIAAIVLSIMIIFSSCKKQEETEYKDIYGDVVYTDSFSPPDWENPSGRIKIEAEDKDLGKFIPKDVMEPDLRKIVQLVEGFMLKIRNNENDELKLVLTPSAYNSFILRYPDIKFDKDYEIRIGYPKDMEQEKFWVEFKLLFPHNSMRSKFQLESFKDYYVISDFDSKFFTDIENILKKPAEKTNTTETKK
jgi:hypothetical protein